MMHMFYILLFITKKATHPKNIIDDQLFKLISIFNEIEIVPVLETLSSRNCFQIQIHWKFSHGETI